MYSRRTTPRDDWGFVILDSCRSIMYIGMQTGKVLQDERFTIIHPDDAAAFQRFLAEVKVVLAARPEGAGNDFTDTTFAHLADARGEQGS